VFIKRLRGLLTILLTVVILFQCMHGKSQVKKKYEVIWDVYETLARAIGRDVSTLPKIEISGSGMKVASFERFENIIKIDSKALDVCLKMEEDAQSAMAFLLGHELTHFFQEEIQSITFTGDSRFPPQRRLEQIADVHGAFFANLADFESYSVVPKLLERIYRAYHLEDKDLPNYPPLEERKNSGLLACRKAELYSNMLHLSHYLSATGRFAEAIRCYTYLLQTLPYPEIYQNLGAAQLRAAQRLRDPNQERAFRYPFVIDNRSLFRAPTGFSREALIDSAIVNLRNGIGKKRSYAPALLNLACAYEMKNKRARAESVLNTLKEKRKAPIGRLMLRGIMAARDNNDPAARSAFERVNRQSKDRVMKALAQQNIDILLGARPPINQQPTRKPYRYKIDDVKLMEYRPVNPKEEVVVYQDGPLVQEFFYWDEKAQSDIFSYRTAEDVLHKYQLLKKRTFSLQQKVSIGDSREDLHEAYPETRIIWVSFIRGSLAVLLQERLVFRLDEDGQIVEWGTFFP